MNKVVCLCFCLLIVILFSGCSDRTPSEDNVISCFTVHTGDFERSNAIASVFLDDITVLPDSVLTLYEIFEDQKIKTDFQVDISCLGRYLYWILNGESPKGTTRHYELLNEKSTPTSRDIPVRVLFHEGNYEFIFKGNKVLKYNAETVYPPEGSEDIYKRSGFINPLYSPDQTILTRIPNSDSDHLHHYGLWNAWKKVRFRDDEIDFFAPQFGQGTVRHIGMVSADEGLLFGSLQVLREHITWQETDREAVAMADLMDVRVYDNEKDWFIIDITYRYNPYEPFLIEEYRYAGFSFRGTDSWTNKNTDFYTSEGLKRDEADGERSRWCVITGDTGGGKSSIQFMSHPLNFNHPEPMRIWPSDTNEGQGNIYINYNPVRNTNWLLLPGKSYFLKYRIVVKSGTLSDNLAGREWMEFAYPVKVDVISEKKD
jgi:hypothetical protein